MAAEAAATTTTTTQTSIEPDQGIWYLSHMRAAKAQTSLSRQSIRRPQTQIKVWT